MTQVNITHRSIVRSITLVSIAITSKNHKIHTTQIFFVTYAKFMNFAILLGEIVLFMQSSNPGCTMKTRLVQSLRQIFFVMSLHHPAILTCKERPPVLAVAIQYCNHVYAECKAKALFSSAKNSKINFTDTHHIEFYDTCMEY